MTSKTTKKNTANRGAGPLQNEFTRQCSWRAAGVDTVANTRWYKSLWCQLPDHIHHKESHAECKRMMNYNNDLAFLKRIGANTSNLRDWKRFLFFFQDWNHNVTIVTLEDTWNIDKLCSKVKVKKRTLCEVIHRDMIYSSVPFWSINRSPVLFNHFCVETFKMWYIVVGHLVALRCNQSRIVFFFCLWII